MRLIGWTAAAVLVLLVVINLQARPTHTASNCILKYGSDACHFDFNESESKP